MSLTLNPYRHLDWTDRRTSPELSDVARLSLHIMLFSAIFLQRFAINLGQSGIPLCLLVNLCAVSMLVLAGQVRLAPLRTALVLLFAACVPLCMLLGSASGSWASALFVLTLYMPFALVLQSGGLYFEEAKRTYRKFMTICAMLGILQFLLQFVISSTWLFTFARTLPASILLEGFNTLQPLEYGASLFKSNGFLMIEPSTFSQFVAIALVIEVLFYDSAWRMVVYGVALLLSYSGSGLIVVGLIPFILVSRGSYKPILIIAVFCVVAALTAGFWNGDILINRATTEFTSTDTSAHERYRAPIDLIDRFLLSSPSWMTFGYGPGSFRTFAVQMPYAAADPPWAKLLFEYGLAGYLFFWPMFLVAIFHESRSGWLSLALLIGYLVFGGSLMDPRLQAVLLAFCVLPKRKPSENGEFASWDR